MAKVILVAREILVATVILVDSRTTGKRIPQKQNTADHAQRIEIPSFPCALVSTRT